MRTFDLNICEIWSQQEVATNTDQPMKSRLAVGGGDDADDEGGQGRRRF